MRVHGRIITLKNNCFDFNFDLKYTNKKGHIGSRLCWMQLAASMIGRAAGGA